MTEKEEKINELAEKYARLTDLMSYINRRRPELKEQIKFLIKNTPEHITSMFTIINHNFKNKQADYYGGGYFRVKRNACETIKGTIEQLFGEKQHVR